jgi:hypothetical protein
LLRRPPAARENEQQKSSNLNSKNGLRVLKKKYIYILLKLKEGFLINQPKMRLYQHLTITRVRR